MERKRIATTLWTLTLFLCVSQLFSAHPDTLRATKKAEWGRNQAAHLLRRAGFGGSPEQIDFLIRLGRDKAVDYLVDYEKIPHVLGAYEPVDENEEFLLELNLESTRNEEERRTVREKLRRLNRRNMENVRAWWIQRMITTGRPLEEKMTLFWHGHFTSGFREVKSWRLLYEQNDFFRTNALGDFSTILKGISRDGAMLIYLDNNTNVKSHPNENYARELLELFTLGVGNYSEKDIKNVASAFTGFGLNSDGFFFDPEKHDFGKKRIFRSQGKFDGDDVIALILRRKACSLYMARRLLEFFVYRDPDKKMVDSLAGMIRKTGFDFRKVMRALFRSDAFYSERAMLSQIKSPIELVIGTVRMLELKAFDPGLLAAISGRMGQILFQPPNVKGWDGDRKWITTNTLFERYNFTGLLINSKGRRGEGGDRVSDRRPTFRHLIEASPQTDRGEGADMTTDMGNERLALGQDMEGKGTYRPGPYNPRGTLFMYNLLTAKAVADHYLERLLAGTPSPERYRILLEAFSPAEHLFRRDAPDRNERIRNLILLITSTPEYQLN